MSGLFRDAALEGNDPSSPQGCISAPTDGDCEPVFFNLGLPWQGAGSPGQTAFVIAEP